MPSNQTRRGRKRKKFKRSKRLMRYHSRAGRPVIHTDKAGRTFVMVRKKGGGTKRLYRYRKFMV